MSLGQVARDGSKTPIAGLNGLSGELVPSVALYQHGTVTATIPAVGGTNSVTVTLDEAMPDTDYVINVQTHTRLCTTFAYEKTTTSFKILVQAFVSYDEGAETNITWQAFKLMTDEVREADANAIEANATAIAANTKLITELGERNRKVELNDTHSSAAMSGYWWKFSYMRSDTLNDYFGTRPATANSHYNQFSVLCYGSDHAVRVTLNVGTDTSGKVSSVSIVGKQSEGADKLFEAYADTANNCFYIHQVNNWTCFMSVVLENQFYKDTWEVSQVSQTLCTFGTIDSSMPDKASMTAGVWKWEPEAAAYTDLSSTVTLGENITRSGRIFAYTVGAVVNLTVNLVTSTVAATGSVTLFTLPASFKPRDATFGTLRAVDVDGGLKAAPIAVNSNGTIQLMTANYPANCRFQGTFTYMRAL